MKNPFLYDYEITSPYGWRNNGTDWHNGVDIVCHKNFTVIATDDGVIETSTIITDKNNLTWQWGNYVKLRTNDGYEIFYCHLAERKVNKGDKVHKGDVLGIMGNTGYSFGRHLHYEVRRNGKTLNAPEYLGILNQEGIATPIIEEDDDMELTEEMILKATGDRKVKEYEDAPDYAKDLMRELLDNGIINGGTSYEVNPNDINSTKQHVDLLVLVRRMIKFYTGK